MQMDIDYPEDAVLYSPTRPTMTLLYPGCDLSIEQLVSALTKAVATEEGCLGRYA